MDLPPFDPTGLAEQPKLAMHLPEGMTHEEFLRLLRKELRDIVVTIKRCRDWNLSDSERDSLKDEFIREVIQLMGLKGFIIISENLSDMIIESQKVSSRRSNEMNFFPSVRTAEFVPTILLVNEKFEDNMH